MPDPAAVTTRPRKLTPSPNNGRGGPGRSKSSTKVARCPSPYAADQLMPGELFDRMVTIKVGPQKQEFHTYKGVICYQSSFFRAALMGHFREGHSGVVELPTEDPKIFSLVNTWLNTGRLYRVMDNGKSVPLDGTDLCSLFVFGDAHGMPGLKNTAIDHIIRRTSERWSLIVSKAPFVYDNTPESSPLRKLIVDQLVKCVDIKDRKDWMLQHCPKSTDYPEFLLDVVDALDTASPTKPGRQAWKEINPCDYHDHSDLRNPYR